MPRIYTDNKLMSGTIGDANLVNYNNAISGLESTTVKSAIDEVQEEIVELNNNITPSNSMESAVVFGTNSYYNQCESSVIPLLNPNNKTITLTNISDITGAIAGDISKFQVANASQYGFSIRCLDANNFAGKSYYIAFTLN